MAQLGLLRETGQKGLAAPLHLLAPQSAGFESNHKRTDLVGVKPGPFPVHHVLAALNEGLDGLLAEAEDKLLCSTAAAGMAIELKRVSR